jgi:hypothetical protein
MYFKVMAVGENNDTTETYKFHYTVRTGLNVNSVVESNFESKVNLYPNPNSGRFVVDLGTDYANVHLTVFDVSGKQVYQTIDSGNSFVLNVNIPKGVYFLNAVAAEKSARFKFVVE